MKKIVTFLLVATLFAVVTPYSAQAIISTGATQTTYIELQETKPVKILADYRRAGYSGVIDVGTYTDWDEASALQRANTQQGWKGLCSSCMKPYPVGTGKAVMMGRNMDLPNSPYPAYVLRTELPGKYRTVGMGYMSNHLETFDQIAETSTIDTRMYDLLPFMCTDVMNEKGLVIEMNMREASDKIRTTGTNPGKPPVAIMVLSHLLASRCATIEEMLKFADNYNVFGAQGEKLFAWHVAMAVMDATGRYGVLELVNNKLVWSESVPGQTNFWVDKTAYKIAGNGIGLGRWTRLMKNYPSIYTMEDMFNSMQNIWYSAMVKSPREAHFDINTEFVNFDISTIVNLAESSSTKYGIVVDPAALAKVKRYADQQKAQKICWTTEYITDPHNAQEVYEVTDFLSNCMRQLPQDVRRNSGLDPCSAISYVVNTQEKVFHVKFFEQNETFEIGFTNLND